MAVSVFEFEHLKTLCAALSLEGKVWPFSYQKLQFWALLFQVNEAHRLPLGPILVLVGRWSGDNGHVSRPWKKAAMPGVSSASPVSPLR